MTASRTHLNPTFDDHVRFGIRTTASWMTGLGTALGGRFLRLVGFGAAARWGRRVLRCFALALGFGFQLRQPLFQLTSCGLAYQRCCQSIHLCSVGAGLRVVSSIGPVYPLCANLTLCIFILAFWLTLCLANKVNKYTLIPVAGPLLAMARRRAVPAHQRYDYGDRALARQVAASNSANVGCPRSVSLEQYLHRIHGFAAGRQWVLPQCGDR